MNNNADMQDFDYKEIKRHRKLLHLTQDELAEWMGLKRQSIFRYEKGDAIPAESKKKLNHFFKAETKEELYGNPTDGFGMEYRKLPEGNYLLNIPYVPASGYNGFLEISDWGEAKLGLVFDKINSGFYAAFEIKGEAMDDNGRNSLKPGDIVVTREIRIGDWDREIKPADIWVIILKNDILIRRVDNYNPDKKRIAFKAANPSLEYADFNLNVSDIKRIFQVKQKIQNF